ncbi:MAG: sulfatase-like hydrolase/transferase [Anaerolineaceae bacterium]|nr:sulfatase-like hydrolase/transferase [Anaerolineaceae bacterium]
MPPPNILVIMSDDHAQWASGCYGNRELHTPALDHLAAGGLRMDKAFTPTPVCSPARASFFTGLLPSQHGIHDWLWYDVNVHSEAQRSALAGQPSLAGQVTLAQRLAQAGYRCGLSGKWHCGGDDTPQPGFHFWDALRANRPALGGAYSVGGTFVERRGWHSEIITDNALRFLREREREQPFFLFVGYIGTHSPWSGHPERLVTRYRDARFDDIPQNDPGPHGQFTGEGINVRDREEALAQYYAAVSHIDEGVGRLLDELEAQGLREDTLVLYTSDHGLNCSHHGLWGKGNATRPPNMLEESIRVPLLFNWPGRVTPGRAAAHFVDHCDVHATLLDLAGLDADSSGGPGRSLAPLFGDAAALPDWRRFQAGEYGPTRMWRTSRYKLVREGPGTGAPRSEATTARTSPQVGAPRSAVTTARTSPQGGRSRELLFDLQADPRETRDIRAAEPQLAADLGAQLDAFFAQYDVPERSGLRAPQGPRHNFHEAWRERLEL